MSGSSQLFGDRLRYKDGVSSALLNSKYGFYRHAKDCCLLSLKSPAKGFSLVKVEDI